MTSFYRRINSLKTSGIAQFLKRYMVKKNPKTKEVTEKIIGRLREQELLRDLVASKKSEFIAIYGRRRVGKTYLIKNLMDSLPCVFFHVTGLQKGSSKEQLEEFAKQIGTTFYQSPSIIPQRAMERRF